MKQHNHSTNDVQTVSPSRDPYERLLLQSAVLKQLNVIHGEFKNELAAELRPGDKHPVKNAQGLALGSVSMSAPGKKAVCTDKHVLLAEADERGMEIVDGLPDTTDPRHQEIIDLLFDLRPDLLESHVVKDDAEKLAAEVLQNWQITGELPTGWEIKEASEPRLTVSPGRSTAAKAAIAFLVEKAGSVLEITDGKEA